MPQRLFMLLLLLLSLGALRAWADDLPAAATTKIDFSTHIAPILKKSCVSCHTQGKHKGALSLETRADLLEGGESGAVVVPGKSGESLLIKLVAGQDETRIMPEKGDRLTKQEIGLLRAWIDQGLQWPAEVTFGFPRAPLALKNAKPPAGDAVNPIDRFLNVYYADHRVSIPGPVDDPHFARRVYLDLIGLLPTPAQLNAFLMDKSPNKREKLVDQLLANRKDYADHWLTFWNDHLRNAYRGTGFIDGGRKVITPWLHLALYDNMPYDRFVHLLVCPTPESEGFIKGFVWRGVVNASQATPIQAAQNVAQVFLGTNLKCASCHDSFVNHWRLKDAYALANVFADQPMEIHRCDKPTGKQAGIGFIYPEVGQVDEKLTKRERLRQLADLLTKKENGRLARTIVNRLWAHLMGRGLVEPLDDLDQTSWHPELLDWLSADFVEHGYDLKHTLRMICTSKAYQSAAMDGGEKAEKQFVFRGPSVRRLTAEQFVDGLSSLTGVWPTKPAVFLATGGKPIFESAMMRDGSLPIDVDITGKAILRLVIQDGGDGPHFDWADWGEPRLAGPEGTKRLTDLKWEYARTGHGKVEVNKNVVGEPIRIAGARVEFGIGAHAVSEIVYRLPPGYTRFRAIVGPDTGAVEKKSPVSVQFQIYTQGEEALHARAVALNDDELTRALGRPNREQVVTRRDSLPTLLQALELTNGSTLDRQLKGGARALVTRHPWSSNALVDEMYRHALARSPNAAERGAALAMVGRVPTVNGVADFLWSLAVLPEFQMTY